MDSVTLLIEILFTAVFVGAVVRLFRGHDPLALDVTLVFSGLAAIFALQVVGTFVEVPQALQLLPVVLLLAQPFFTLRLVGRLRALPAWLLPVAAVALLLSTVPILALAVLAPGSPLLAPLGIGLIGVFGVTEIVAAGFLAAEARRRVGSGRIRMAVAAIATAGFAVAILAAGVASGTAENQGGSGATTRVIGLLSALAYVVAFLPPTWLRRRWQAARILYVEDEELNRALLRAVLQRAPDLRLRSAAFLEARTLAQARAILTEGEIDIVLLDVRLPDGSGLDLLREIKLRNPNLGVVVMSASVLPEEREEAMKAGSDAFVAKPYVPGDLFATLHRILPAAQPSD